MFTDAPSKLPEMYDSWLQDALQEELPTESRATCNNCAMCPPPDDTPTEIYPFRPDIKCCAHTPRLPNFLVGQILASEEMEHGVASLSKQIEARSGVDPLGVGASAAQRLLYDNSVNVIGRSRKLRCPHFVDEDGSCGIWKHRNHLCSTWFCKHDRGALGSAFWHSVQLLLKSIERDLSHWAALEAGVSAEALCQLMSEADKSPNAPLDAEEIDGRVADGLYAAYWGKFVGAERDFYRDCASRISGLSWSDVQAICSPEVRARLKVAKLALCELSKPFQTLRVGTYQLAGVNADGIRAITHSSLDTIAIPQPVLNILHLFDGSTAEQIFERIEREYGMRLSDELINHLVDYQLLLKS